MNNFKKVLLSPNATIRRALEIIDSGSMKIALVVDEDQKLLGTLSDGDVRRAILSGRGLENSIETIYYRTPTTCGINDSKAKILQLAFSQKLYQIPIVDSEGRIVGIAEVDELLQPALCTNKVILMAGGLGTRLSPLTDTTPKPMLHVGNKPILETIIENFSKYGYTEIILSVNYKSHIIKEYFGDGSAFGVNLEYVHEAKRMGTAGALALIRDNLTEPFFVMNGDLLTNVNFEHMHDYHLSHDAVATMAVREYDFQVPYGVVNVSDGKIVSIEEKPTHKFFVSAGIYMLSPQVLEHIPEDEFFDMPTLFEKLIAKGNNAVSFPIREYWLDIGRMSDYERANNEYGGVFS
ncbi:nucleotidyltransferase family protein [Devosia sp.]|uniref:nucleotidyltransferase family protein n=1 Tax=Devosia sp. TaxID=1871048 RepID=UPI0027344781|nr:nucleotidyltransferase family protein [Devosia sp.]MDP2782322.1 nucleotidyltransferase family protein [Devosia sp.]